MNIAIIAPIPNFAGPNIKKNLLERSEWQEEDKFEGHPVYHKMTDHHDVRLFTSEKNCLELDDYDQRIESWGFRLDAIIIATTHKSAAGTPSFSVHPIGNWTDDASFGGKARAITAAPAHLMRACLDALAKHNTTEHLVTMEATHHGPSLTTPTMFVEIGSDEKAWKTQAYGKIVAKALLDVASNPLAEYPIAFGIGGAHYCPNFMSVMKKENIAMGHICAKYGLEGLDSATLLDAMEKSNANVALLDWKGLGEHKERIIAILEKNKLHYQKTKDVKNNTGLPKS